MEDDGKKRKARVVDFHSHILPAMDDGARNVEISRRMLCATWEQKVRKMVATPHFYPQAMRLTSFLERRERAVEELLTVWDAERSPRIYLGAEVAFFPRMEESGELDNLTIAGTSTILVEMPFERWEEASVRSLLEMRNTRGLEVVVAHIERYMEWQRKDTLETLRREGIVLQTNASAILERKTRKTMLRLIEEGYVSLLGSDAHDTEERRQRIGEARECVREELGEEYIEAMLGKAKTLLHGAVPIGSM